MRCAPALTSSSTSTTISYPAPDILGLDGSTAVGGVGSLHRGSVVVSAWRLPTLLGLEITLRKPVLENHVIAQHVTTTRAPSPKFESEVRISNPLRHARSCATLFAWKAGAFHAAASRCPMSGGRCSPASDTF
jgi:hypothetical protein